MGWIRKVIVGRWLGRWLLRGGPWSIAAKLALVAVYGAWKWRREARRVEEDRASREIAAEYEVVEEGAERPPSGQGRIPAPEEQGRKPSGTKPGVDPIPSDTPENRQTPRSSRRIE